MILVIYKITYLYNHRHAAVTQNHDVMQYIPALVSISDSSYTYLKFLFITAHSYSQLSDNQTIKKSGIIHSDKYIRLPLFLPKVSFLTSSAHRFLINPTTALTKEEEAPGQPKISEESFIPPCVHITTEKMRKKIVKKNYQRILTKSIKKNINKKY